MHEFFTKSSDNVQWMSRGLPIESRGWSKKPKLISHSFPGAYPIFYLVKFQGEDLWCCPSCANRFSLNRVEKAFINYEDENLHCDRCEKQIKSAYGE